MGEYASETVVLMARQYIETLFAAPKTWGDELDRHMSQVRMAFSDALRDAGCHDEQVHTQILAGGGVSLAALLLEHSHAD